MIQIAILGYGTVGSGVAEVLEKNMQTIAGRVDKTLNIKYILDLRDFPDSPYGDKHIKDFSIIDQDPEIQIVVEVMGGSGAAYQFTKTCLEKGRSVVTSNKELVALHGAELLSVAKKHNANYLFEASVGGGIPIIKGIHQCLAANKIEEVYGILNGTTNYILSKMVKEGSTFEYALKEAQELGYAEADPTADVAGIDAARKICILTSLSTGTHFYPETMQTTGITQITQSDILMAKRMGRVIKLLGRSVISENGKVCAVVAPFLIEQSHPLATVEDVNNAIFVRGNAIGQCMFYGPGAGKLPTASAVVADIMDAAKHTERRIWLDWVSPTENMIDDGKEVFTDLYLRVSNRQHTLPDVLAAIQEAFGGTYSILSAESDDFYAFVLHGQAYKTLEENVKKLKKRNISVENYIRLL